jgi:NAD+ kinase
MRIKYIPSKDPRCININNLVSEKFPQLLKEKKPELLLIAGGDGALLHAIQDYNKLKLPFFGYANGTLNFLMNKIDNLEKTVELLLKNKIKLDFLETTSIKVTIKKGKKQKFLGYAVNEVILGTYIMGYHHFLLSSQDGSFDNFEIKGSGVCICTDLGSTGYNFSLGGSVLPISSNLWSINGIVCNRFLQDIINSQNFEIKLSENSRPANIFLDGVQKKIEINKNTSILLSKGEVIKIGFLDKDDFFNKRLEITSRYRK